MYLFKKKVDLYDDVILSGLEVARKCIKVDHLISENEPCAKYFHDYKTGKSPKYYINQEIEVNCFDYSSDLDKFGGFLTIYDEFFEEYKAKVIIRVHTAVSIVEKKYSKLSPGDKVKVCGLVELYVRPGHKVDTTLIITIWE